MSSARWTLRTPCASADVAGCPGLVDGASRRLTFRIWIAPMGLVSDGAIAWVRVSRPWRATQLRNFLAGAYCQYTGRQTVRYTQSVQRSNAQRPSRWTRLSDQPKEVAVGARAARLASGCTTARGPSGPVRTRGGWSAARRRPTPDDVRPRSSATRRTRPAAVARLAPAARAAVLERRRPAGDRAPRPSGRPDRPASSASRSRTAAARSTGSPTRSRSARPRPGRSAARCCRSPAGTAASGNTALTYRAPAGVALAITPFNAPANLLAHKLGRVVRGRQHHHRQGAAAGAGRLRRRGGAAARGRACRSRRCSCCTAAARSAPGCARRTRSP